MLFPGGTNIIGIEAKGLYQKNKNGIDIYAFELIKQLQATDTENQYIVFCLPGSEKNEISETKNFKIVEIPGPKGVIWDQYMLPRAVQHHSCSFLHCTNSVAPVFCPTPFIITVHNIDLIKGARNILRILGNSPRNKSFCKHILFRTILSRSQKVIAVSHYEKALIVKLYRITENKITVIHHGISNAFKTTTDTRKVKSLMVKYRLPEEYILTLGSQHIKKNIHGVLKAYSVYHENTINPLPIVIVDFTELQLRTILSELGIVHLQESIYITPYISNRELPVLYRSAHMFICLSRNESFGLPVLEAMSCGTPVIAANESSLPEICNGSAILVKYNDYAGIANNITQLSVNYKLRQTMSQNGIKHAELFTWRNTAIKVLATYMSLS